MDVAGFATGLGLRRYRHHPRRTAEAVRQLRGVSALTKLVTPELSIGLAHGSRNPRFPHLAPSGSSTGSAVAVASHVCDIALGTDTVASTRLPAAACGLVGLRTTHRPGGLDGVFPLSPRLDAVGWLARTADDLAYFRRPRRAAGAPRRAVGAAGGRLRAVRPRGVADLPGVARALRRRPGRVHGARARRRCGDRRGPVRAAVRCPGPRPRAGRRLVRGGRRRCVVAGGPRPPRRADAPVGDLAAVPHPGEAEFEQRVGYCPVAAFAGLPALALPVAIDPVHRASVTMQLVGPPGSEAELIQLARHIGRAVGGPVFPQAAASGCGTTSWQVARRSTV
ncbi:amidase family protein [Streptomyces sp. ITFR-16]|uniref:amidase family protein n=1 Tax=Streptomyces sp. ITFR-16 TaxID=3075198 RepID=UPI0028894392|nr:amidase family protein [Streptomyces sp. ITFR-16]WNI23331.1 amidase family protein [Streptomyces sp. ITFR-16]